VGALCAWRAGRAAAATSAVRGTLGGHDPRYLVPVLGLGLLAAGVRLLPMRSSSSA